MVIRKDEAIALGTLQKAIDDNLATFRGAVISIIVPPNITEERLNWLVDKYIKACWKVDKRLSNDRNESYWTLYFQ